MQRKTFLYNMLSKTGNNALGAESHPPFGGGPVRGQPPHALQFGSEGSLKRPQSGTQKRVFTRGFRIVGVVQQYE
jgi:hypothetical protein